MNINKENEQFQYKTNLKKRFFASFIDYLLIFVLTYIYISRFGIETEEGIKSVQGLTTLPIIIVWFLYFVVIETYKGATLGHKAFNLLVLTDKRKKIGFMQALKRHLVDPVDFFIYAIPAIMAIKNTDKKQRLGDLWAKTIVVDTNDPEQYAEIIFN
jgi:uncharacterized RDD family membrane protein YckC